MAWNLVLSSAEAVMRQAEHVSIDSEAVERAAHKFASEEMKIPDWTLPVFPAQNNLATIDFFMLGNSLNFAFRDFQTKKDFAVEYQGQQWRGAMAMWASLKRALDSGKPILEGSYLANISCREVEDIFSGTNPIPMLQQRFEILREVGHVLKTKYDNHFCNLVQDSRHRLFNCGQGLVERLTSDFPSFDDSAVYKGRNIIFDKRAQLAPGMLYGRFKNQEPFHVEDIDELTVFADYGIPKTMRHLGIMVYSPELASKVDNQEVIPAKSNEEVEIRAATVCAADMLIKKINEYRDAKNNPARAVNALHIDYKLWSESRSISTPHHLTITTDY